MVEPHCLGNLRGIEFGIRLKAGIGRTFCSTFEQEHTLVASAPALGEHSVRRELWGRGLFPRRIELTAEATGKRHHCKRLGEWIIVKVEVLPCSGKAVGNNPIDII